MRRSWLALCLLFPGCIFGEKSLVAAEHSCARAKDGAVYCWGWNFDRALGDGTTKPRRAPVRTGVSRAAEVAVGANHSCARTEDGAVYCWGRGLPGAPAAVEGLAGAAS